MRTVQHTHAGKAAACIAGRHSDLSRRGKYASLVRDLPLRGEGCEDAPESQEHSEVNNLARVCRDELPVHRLHVKIGARPTWAFELALRRQLVREQRPFGGLNEDKKRFCYSRRLRLQTEVWQLQLALACRYEQAARQWLLGCLTALGGTVMCACHARGSRVAEAICSR